MGLNNLFVLKDKKHKKQNTQNEESDPVKSINKQYTRIYSRNEKKYTKTIKYMFQKEIDTKLNNMGLLDKNGKVKKKYAMVAIMIKEIKIVNIKSDKIFLYVLQYLRILW